MATAAERERDLLRAQAPNQSPSRGSNRRWGEGKGGGGGSGGAGGRGGVKYLMAGSQAWKAQAEKVKGEL